MIATEAIAVVLLAAGTSSRFGPCDKLAVPLEGLPLGLHAARTLGRLPFAARIAVCGRAGPRFAAYGFAPVVNPDPTTGQSGSIRLGLTHARAFAPKAVLIALADMPFVTTSHVLALLGRLDGEHLVVGSTDGRRPSPPALFDASLFSTLEGLRGDGGARSLLRGALLIPAPRAELSDVDTPEDLPPDPGGRRTRGPPPGSR